MNTIKVERKHDYAILHLNSGKANPINMEMMGELTQTVEAIAKDEEIRGLVIGGQPGFFSVGLDVKELAAITRETCTAFFSGFNRMIFTLLQFPKPMVCAITGHSPAGGCLISICADYRVMANDGPYVIGLNEMPVGIMVPPHVLELYGFWVGKGKAYQYLMEGKLHSPEEALAINLVDELCATNEVLAKAEAKMQQYMAFDPVTVLGMKINLRNDLIRKMIALAQQVPIDTEQHFWRPGPQAALKKILAKI